MTTTQQTSGASTNASGARAEAAATGPTLAILTPGGASDDRSQTIVGTLTGGTGGFDPTGRIVEVDDGGVKVAAATVTADGTWSAPILLSDLGANVLTASVAGVAGQVVESGPVVLTLQTVLSPPSGATAPAAPEAAIVNRPAHGATASATDGVDSFVFRPHPGHVTVEGFSARGIGHDTLSFSSRSFASIVDILHHTTMSGGDAVIHLSPTDSVTLAGVSKADLRAGRDALALHG